MKTCKEAHEDHGDTQTVSHLLDPIELSTPPLSASPKYDELNSRDLRKLNSSPRAPSQSDPKPPKQALKREAVDLDDKALFAHDNKRRRKSFTEPAESWADRVNRWIESDCPTISAKQAAEAVSTLPTIPTIETAETTETAEDDQISQSQQSGRLNTSSPLYRGILWANGVRIDPSGSCIPPEVRALVAKHFPKQRDSPRLDEEEVRGIQRKIEQFWSSAETSMLDMFKEPLFPSVESDPVQIKKGGDTVWNKQALPREPDYAYAIPQPKTDCHFGFPFTAGSRWDLKELSVADHPYMRPYSQPSSENMFPSYLREIKSEIKGGTLFAAEGQLASAGAHRVNSWLWVLDQLDPDRTERSSADAVVFSDAVTQRQVVAYVHYFNPKDGFFWMSYIDHFYFGNFDDIQRCRDHMENAMGWLLGTQEVKIRDALRRLQPIAQKWKKGRPASAGTADSMPVPPDSDGQRSGKKARLE